MRSSRFRPLVPCLALAGGLTLFGCSGSSSSGGPRITPIPRQSATGGGSAFALDLSPFVTAPQGATLTYSVVDGAGSFQGSTFQGGFPTLGDYRVTFAVSDGAKASVGTFAVRVTAANLAAVNVDGAGLALFDTDTGEALIVSASGHSDTFRAGLASGHVVFERTIGGNVDLWVYDPFERVAIALGRSTTRDERYVAHTADGHVLFTTGAPGQRDLFVWNAATGVTKGIAIDDTLDEHGAVVAADGKVFYEVVANGAADVWCYDPVTDETTAVATDASDERIVGTPTDGGIVFTRPGDTAEDDLFHFGSESGLQEVGQDQPALDALDKVFRATTSQGLVVFSAIDATATNVWVWDPATADSTQASAATATETNVFGAVTAGDIVVFTATDTVNGGNDVVGFSVANGTTTVANAGNATHAFEAVTTIDGQDAVVYTIPGGSTSLHVYNFTTAQRHSATAASYRFDAVLADGKIAFTQTSAGGALFVGDPRDGTITTVVGAGAPIYRANGPAAGDVVFEREVGGATDVFLWSAASGTVTAISTDPADDAFAGIAAGGAHVLFTRVVTGNTNRDLFRCAVADGTVTRLTAEDGIGNLHDHTVAGTFAAVR